MADVKYDKAYDSKLNKWVTVNDLNIADRYDKPRYYSSDKWDEIGEASDILTYRKETKLIIFKKPEKHEGEQGFTRTACFIKVCDNTKENRERLSRQCEHQESVVHRIAKSVAKDLKFIKIPPIIVNLAGTDYEIVREQYIKVKYKGEECKDTDTNRIPDLIFETEYLGVKEEIFVEIYYKHRVDEAKKREFRYYAKNCIEIDISELRNNLCETDIKLKTDITNAIVENGYWISNKFQEWFSREFINKYIIDLNLGTHLFRTEIHKGEKITYRNRLYIHIEDLNFADENICQSLNDKLKTCNIGNCLECSNCIGHKDVYSSEFSKVHIYCNSGKVDLASMQRVECVKTLVNLAFKEYKERV
jgi:hypothetical protein